MINSPLCISCMHASAIEEVTQGAGSSSRSSSPLRGRKLESVERKVAAFFYEQIYGHALVRLEISGASVWSLSAPHGAVNLPEPKSLTMPPAHLP